MSFRYKVLEHCIKAVDIKKMYAQPEDKLLNILQTKYRAYDLPEIMYKRFDIEKKNLDSHPVFKIQIKDRKSENIILFIHGGGGMMCPTPIHYRFAANLVRNTGASLYFPFYPLGPEASIYESLEWLDKVYTEIIREHNSKNITVIGDSAGASLSLNVCAHAKKKPKGIVLISPSVGADKCDERMSAMEKYDLILSVRTIELVNKYWIKDISSENTVFNTLDLNYTAFPPIQLYYGTNELFYPYISDFINKIRNDGVLAETIKGEGLCHDWALIGIIPEGRKAFLKICEFIMNGV